MRLARYFLALLISTESSSKFSLSCINRCLRTVSCFLWTAAIKRDTHTQSALLYSSRHNNKFKDMRKATKPIYILFCLHCMGCMGNLGVHKYRISSTIFFLTDALKMDYACTYVAITRHTLQADWNHYPQVQGTHKWEQLFSKKKKRKTSSHIMDGLQERTVKSRVILLLDLLLLLSGEEVRLHLLLQI